MKNKKERINRIVHLYVKGEVIPITEVGLTKKIQRKVITINYGNSLCEMAIQA